jgi:membrane-bound serine protease (ClpP class)
MEFKTPGLSIFGIIGLILLGIVFGSKYAVGLADHTELLLLMGGFLLFMAEIYLFPGTFIAGILGLLLIMAALALSFQSFTVPDPSMPWEAQDMIDNLALTVGLAVGAAVIPVLAVRFVGDRLPARGGIISGATLAGSRVESAEAAQVSVGQAGQAKTPLKPAGKAVFGGRTLEVTSRGEFIEAGTEIEVAQIQGNTILVRPRGNHA